MPISNISSLFMRIFSRLLGRRRGALVAALVIAFYTLLVGREPRWCEPPSWAGWRSLPGRRAAGRMGWM